MYSVSSVYFSDVAFCEFEAMRAKDSLARDA